MATTLLLTGGVTITPPIGPADNLIFPSALAFTIAGSNWKKFPVTVPTTAGGTAIVVTGLSGLGRYLLINLDPTNIVELLDAVSGNIIGQVSPGLFATGEFPSTCTAPALLALVSPVRAMLLIAEK